MDLSFARWTILAPVVCLTFGSAIAQDPAYSSLPQPVALVAPTTKEMPASITDPSGTLPLATGGPYVFDPLPMRGNGCRPQPIIGCTGPDFCGCTKRIYYGTNPCDDDPVLPLPQSGYDPKTKHWYQHAYDMVIRKKSVTEFFK